MGYYYPCDECLAKILGCRELRTSTMSKTHNIYDVLFGRYKDLFVL